MTQLIDCSHTIVEGQVTYKGLPAPIICDYLSREASRRVYAPGTEFHIGKIEMVANTGTYIDSPFHRYEHGIDIAALPLDSIADLDGIVITATQRPGRAITAEAFRGHDVRGRAVLVHTDWADHWQTDAYFEGHPHLTADAAEFLVQAGAKLVGIDSYNIDNTDGGDRPVHSTLLAANIPIVEHMCNVAQVPRQGFRFYAVPAPVQGMGTFPVRAVVVIPAE
jgi:kynurenine formamidase